MKNIPDPLSEEYIRKHTVGALTPLTSPIALLEYDEQWPAQFACEAERIQSALVERALLLEHVGSTSVPGLVAKPIIDIVLVVEDSSNEGNYLPALEDAGYKLRIREPEWHQHRMVNSVNSSVNLHVFSRGCSEVNRMLVFRNWLRTNASDRELYAQTKRDLAQREWKYMQNYADAKAGVVAEIMERAQNASRKAETQS